MCTARHTVCVQHDEDRRLQAKILMTKESKQSSSVVCMCVSTWKRHNDDDFVIQHEEGRAACVVCVCVHIVHIYIYIIVIIYEGPCLMREPPTILHILTTRPHVYFIIFNFQSQHFMKWGMIIMYLMNDKNRVLSFIFRVDLISKIIDHILIIILLVSSLELSLVRAIVRPAKTASYLPV